MFKLANWQDCRTALEESGVVLPKNDVAAAKEAGRRQPRWIHLGGGNLYRAFHAEVAQDLLDESLLDRGVVVLETFSPFTVDSIYAPYNGDILQVVMGADGAFEERVLASTADSLFANVARPDELERARAYFRSRELQLVTLTITEKGYVLSDAQGNPTPSAREELEAGPLAPTTSMGMVCSLLLDRYRAGAAPIAMVSTDNFSRNGERFRAAVLEVAAGWLERGHIPQDFMAYLSDESRVSFPWTMIDRITPNPSPETAEQLADRGWEDLGLIDTGKGTVFAGFANTEPARYLVVEDSFPNGRPPLERVGVIMCDRETAERADTMKVTACLNPLHTALAVYGCLLGYTRIWQEMRDDELVGLVRRLGYDENLPVVVDPGVVDPRAFIDELLEKRLPNSSLPDAPQRIAADTSQKMPIRFGNTIRSYTERNGDASSLTFVPLVIAGWLRYLMGVDDDGHVFEPSPDPMLDELRCRLSSLTLGERDAATVHGAVGSVLSNPAIFGQDLYDVGLGEKVEGMLLEELGGIGAVRATLRHYMAQT